jgi:hypothetical protein
MTDTLLVIIVVLLFLQLIENQRWSIAFLNIRNFVRRKARELFKW